MRRSSRSLRAALLGAPLLFGFAAPPLPAQEPPTARQVVSANPVGLLLELFNAEYERAVNATAGIGGSFLDLDEETYVNLDVFWRYYPQGPSRSFYVGIGFGLKRLIGTGDATFDTLFIPTFRIVNIGYAF